MKNAAVSGGQSDQVDETLSLTNGVTELVQETNKVHDEKESLGSIEAPLGTFTKDGKYVAVVSPNGNISLFQTNVESLVSESKTGKLTDRRILELTSRVPLAVEQRKKKKSKQVVEQVISSKAGKVTCMAVSYQPVPNEGSKAVKRRKQISEKNDEVIIAVGFHLGEVLLRKSNGFSDLEVFDGCPESIQAHNKRQVSAICFSEDATRMFSSGHDGNVVVWERTSFHSPPYPKKRIVHESCQSIHYLACNKQGTRLAVGDTEISLYDVENGMKILEFRGHSSPISSLAFFLKDTFLVSCSIHENNAYIWSCDEEMDKPGSVVNEMDSLETNDRELNGQVESKKASKRVRGSENMHMPRVVSGVLRSNFPNRFVNALFEDRKKKYSLLTCILTDGTVLGYQVSSEDLKSKGETPNVLQAPCFTARPFTSDDAVFATAMDATGTFVLFGHGGFLRPVVEAVSFSELVRETNFHLEPVQKGGILRTSSGFSHLNEASNRLVNHLKEERVAEILSSRQTSSQPVLKQSNVGATSAMDSDVAQGLDNEEEEQTLEVRLNHLKVNESESTLEKKVEKQRERPRRNLDTSVRILEQSVIHHDQKLLEKALASVTDRRQIRHTVERLSSNCVVPLLRELILRFESSPNRAKTLLVWIQSILIRHASFLSSTGELIEELKRLQEVMEERLDVFQSILELEGRLELIISHSRRNWEEQKDQEPMFEYNEESSEASYSSDASKDE